MAWETKGNAIVSDDGLIYLHKRADHDDGIWHYRIRMPAIKEKYERKSTKTNSLEKAKDIALRRYYKLLDTADSGLTVYPKQFERVATQYLYSIKPMTLEKDKNYKRVPAEKRAENRYKRNKEYLEKFIFPYLKGKSLLEITNETTDWIHSKRYKEWKEKVSITESIKDKNGLLRKVHYGYLRAPGVQSKNTINRIMKAVFKYAYDTKLITIVEIPEFKMEQVPKRRRGTFREEEWALILKKLDERIDEIPEETQPETKYQRTLFKYFMIFMAATGLRPGEEPRNLKWKNIQYKLIKPSTTRRDNREINTFEHILIKVKEGKTGERTVIGQPEAKEAIEAIRKIHPLLTDEERVPYTNLLHCEKYLWVEKDGSPIKSFKNAFSRLKQSLEWKTNSEEQVITPYSLRHLYATTRLYDGLDPIWLAKNMGTSVAMIWQNYDHIIHETRANQITGIPEIDSDKELEERISRMFK